LHPTGKRHWESYRTRKEAEQALASHVTAIKGNRYVPANDKRTVREAYESWWMLSVEGSNNRSGAVLRHTTRSLYSTVWRVHVEPRWASRKLQSVTAEEAARWQQEMLTAGHGPKTALNSIQILGAIFKHARRFRWIASNPCEDVHKPKYKVKIRAFTAAEVTTLAEKADEATALLIRAAAHRAALWRARRTRMELCRSRGRLNPGAQAVHARRVVGTEDGKQPPAHPAREGIC
jgi:hypothetical protein